MRIRRAEVAIPWDPCLFLVLMSSESARLVNEHKNPIRFG